MGDNYYELNEAAVEYYHTLLKSPQGKAGMDYLRSVNITEETIDKFRIGYTGEDSEGLVKYLRAKRFSQQEIPGSG